MRAAIATVLLLAIASPAHAALDYTLPGGYRSLLLTSGNESIEAKGAFVPVIWFGGPTRFFKLKFEAGGAYLQDPRGGTYTYAVGQSLMNFELPLGPFIPYLGVLGHAAYPFQQPVSGFPYGLMPLAGLGIDLGVIEIDLHAGRGPVWGLSGSSGPLEAALTEVGGRISFTF